MLAIFTVFAGNGIPMQALVDSAMAHHVRVRALNF